MRVIEQKVAFSEWKKEVVCTGKEWNQNGRVPCGSVLEMGKEDLKSRTHHGYGSDEGTDYGFVCPVCGCFTEINIRDLDKHLRKLAIEYRDMRQ